MPAMIAMTPIPPITPPTIGPASLSVQLDGVLGGSPEAIDATATSDGLVLVAEEAAEEVAEEVVQTVVEYSGASEAANASAAEGSNTSGVMTSKNAQMGMEVLHGILLGNTSVNSEGQFASSFHDDHSRKGRSWHFAQADITE